MSVFVHRFERGDLLTLLLVITLAAAARFVNPGTVEFFHDDAMLASLAQDFVSGGPLPTTGINSSVGIPNAPHSVYLFALPFAVDSDPLVAILSVMIWNVFGAGIFWVLARSYFGTNVGLIAAILYAMHPWAAFYSRKIWAQDIHTPLILLGLLLALYTFYEAAPIWEENQGRPGRWLAQVFALPIFITGMLIHFAAWALLPLYGIMLWFGRRQIRPVAFVLSLALTVLVIAPYAVGIQQTLQANPDRLAQAAASSDAADGFAPTLQPIAQLTYLVSGYGLPTQMAPAQIAQMRASFVLVGLVGGGIIALFVLGLASLRAIQPPLRWLLIPWALLPFALLLPGLTGVYPHYFIASIPALLLLVAIGADRLAQRVTLRYPQTEWVPSVVLAAVMLLWSSYWTNALAYVEANAVAYPGFTTPLADLQTVERAVSDADDVIVLSYGMFWDLHHESVIWDVMLRDTASCTRTLIGDGFAVLPDSPFAVIQAPDAPPNPVGGLYANDTRRAYPTREGETDYVVYRWDAPPTWPHTPINIVEPVLFDIGVSLVGYATEAERTVLAWQLPEERPGIDYQYSMQFVGPDGDTLGAHDGPFWPGRHWCAGDRLLTWMNHPVPDEAATLRVILYRLGRGDEPPFINANILDGMGNPAGQSVEIPLP